MTRVRGLALDVCAAAVLAALAAWALGPALRDGGIVGGGEQPDWTGSLWAMWWFGEALSQGRLPWEASANWVPNGQGPVGYLNLMDAAIGAPLVHALGPARGYNAACWLTLWLSGAGTWLSARLLRAGRAGALVAAACVMLSPWLLLELTAGRVAQALVVAPVLALALLALLRDGRGGRMVAVAAGALVAAAALTYWFHGLFVVLAAGVLWLLPGARPRRETLRPLALAAATTAILCGAPVLMLAGDFTALPGMQRALPAVLDHGPLGRDSFSLNMAIARSPGALWPVWSPEWEPADLRLPLMMLGLGALGVALPGAGPRRVRWSAVAALGWMLTLGPWMRWSGGAPLPIPLPWLALHDLLPGFSRLWWPVRASVLAVPALALLAGRGVGALATRLPRWRGPAAALLSALVLAEILGRGAYLPSPRGPGRPFAATLYAQLDGALVTTPVLGRSGDARHLLWLQAHHGHPVLAGLGEHLPAHVSSEQAAFVRANGLLRALHDVAWDRFEGGTVTPADVTALQAAGFRWVVVDPAAYRLGREGPWARQHREVLDVVFGPPAHTEGMASAYAITVPPVAVTLTGLRPIEPDIPEDQGIPVRVRRDPGPSGGPPPSRGRPPIPGPRP